MHLLPAVIFAYVERTLYATEVEITATRGTLGATLKSTLGMFDPETESMLIEDVEDYYLALVSLLPEAQSPNTTAEVLATEFQKPESIPRAFSDSIALY